MKKFAKHHAARFDFSFNFEKKSLKTRFTKNILPEQHL
jgi:hypothetical protein